MKIISVIDYWQHLDHPLEIQIKKNIINFLDQNQDHYIINGCYDIDQCPCDPLLVNYLDANRHRHLEIGIDDYDWSLKHKWQTYTLCGFHSLECLIYRPLGLLHIMEKNLHRHKDITIRFDLSCSDTKGQHEYITWSNSKIKKFLKFPNSPINIVTKSR